MAATFFGGKFFWGPIWTKSNFEEKGFQRRGINSLKGLQLIFDLKNKKDGIQAKVFHFQIKVLELSENYGYKSSHIDG